jgi:glycosyltransferase involved in cell wall biosynthesis
MGDRSSDAPGMAAPGDRETVLTIDHHDPSLPVVSVLIPSFNYGRWTIEAIESVFAQTYRNIELIVVDDGSDPATRALLREFRCSRSDRFTYVEQDNRGIVRTLNALLRHAHGEYITVLAADDALCPEKIAVQVDLLRRLPNVHSVFCPQFEMGPEGDIRGVRGELPRYFTDLIGCGLEDPARPPDRWDVSELILGAVAHPFVPQSALARAHVFRELGGFDETLELDDIDFNLRAALRGFVPRYHPEILHKVRVHPDSSSRRARWMYRETKTALDRFWRQNDVPARLRPYRRYLDALLLQILASNLRAAGQRGEALQQYARLLVRYPDRFALAVLRHARRSVARRLPPERSRDGVR